MPKSHRFLRTDDWGLKPTIAIIIVLLVIVAIVGTVFALGIVKPGPDTEDCPAGECTEENPPIPYTMQIDGRVLNPFFAPPSGVIDSVRGYRATPPGWSFAFPRLDFYGNNYQITMELCVTLPSGLTYCTDGALGPRQVQTGYVGGSAEKAFTFYFYQSGPAGSYSMRATLHYLALGCGFGATCASNIVIASATFKLA